MNKVLKVAVPVLVVVLVLVLAFLVGARQDVKVITYKDYKEIKEKKGYIYYGSKDNLETLKTLSKKADIKIGIVDPEDLSESEIKVEKLTEGTLYLYNNNKVIFKYSDDVNSYKLMSNLMEKDLVKRDYITVTIDEYLEIIKKKGYQFMFIGSETCGYCTQFKESIKQVLKDYSFNIYYIDISTLAEDEWDKLYATDKYFEEEEWGTPLNFLYKDGKRITELNGYVPAEELIAFLQENKVI